MEVAAPPSERGLIGGLAILEGRPREVIADCCDAGGGCEGVDVDVDVEADGSSCSFVPGTETGTEENCKGDCEKDAADGSEGDSSDDSKEEENVDVLVDIDEVSSAVPTVADMRPS